ncbi:LysR family transcriptional regulator [Nocardioides cavernaquae]|uniref:LysR family transcriptional regulator n=1 Tax=Nocardioides cavernaquae TaxID=2321396 RepID=UPI001603C9C1|nr:LysR family transcriptional regulator [Nocardioides cavernaquae]
MRAGRSSDRSRYDPGITDLHTRKLRYFIAVAEELHFSRAAARLFVAQQALSRQIRELEDELGTPLFLRSSRRVELTAAGVVFLAGARAVVDALDEAVATTVRTGRSVTGTLRVGFCPGAALELTEPILSGFRDRYPDVTVELHEVPLSDPSAGVAGGASDVGIVRAPLTTDGIEVETLFTEPLVAAVSVRHRLADRATVNVAELLTDPITLTRTEDAAYRAFWSLEAFRDGAAPRIVETRSVTEEVQFVSAGGAIGVTAAAAIRYMPHPSIRFIPISDAPRSTCAVGWRADAANPLIDRFREVARAVLEQAPQLVSAIEDPFGASAGTGSTTTVG